MNPVLICPICMNRELILIQSDKLKADYYQCPICDLIFIDPEAIVGEEKEKKRYLAHNNTIEQEGYRQMWHLFIEHYILPDQAKTATILDFGCGPGPVLAYLLQQFNFQVHIYDPYFYPDQSVLNHKYDLITAVEVFEHIKAPLSTLKTLLNALNQAGRLLISTHFHPAQQADFIAWWYRQDFTHICFYSSQTFKYLARQYHLKIVTLAEDKICILQKNN